MTQKPKGADWRGSIGRSPAVPIQAARVETSPWVRMACPIEVIELRAQLDLERGPTLPTGPKSPGPRTDGAAPSDVDAPAALMNS